MRRKKMQYTAHPGLLLTQTELHAASTQDTRYSKYSTATFNEKDPVM